MKRKFFVCAVMSLVGVFVFTTTSLALFRAVCTECNIQVKNNGQELEVTIKDDKSGQPRILRVFPIAKYQVTVVWQEGEQCEIAIHKKGLSWQKGTFYLITTKKLADIEAKAKITADRYVNVTRRWSSAIAEGRGPINLLVGEKLIGTVEWTGKYIYVTNVPVYYTINRGLVYIPPPADHPGCGKQYIRIEYRYGNFYFRMGTYYPFLETLEQKKIKGICVELVPGEKNFLPGTQFLVRRINNDNLKESIQVFNGFNWKSLDEFPRWSVFGPWRIGGYAWGLAAQGNRVFFYQEEAGDFSDLF